eukprot:TRINITY_DN6649_c0_g1_i1.p1 TRINITY_DN6649_c0_g1~~TRINITY_DN6649_c0_g1_i1.p1  ORF type:complete len:249 (+),score=56.20 TRINITY_DN6649_c0_g1_i1:68-748(+)
MRIGKMIYADNFNLFDAMSALEMMEPKMDGGMELINRLPAPPSPSSLSVPSLLAIMDGMIACEMTHYNGQPLPISVFTCVYLQAPEEIDHNILKPFSQILLKTCDLVRGIVEKGDVCHEEDFIGISFGFPLCEEKDEVALLQQLKGIEDDLGEKIKLAQSKKPNQGISPLQNISEKEVEFCEALQSRIRLRRYLYMALLNMDKPQLKGMEIAKKFLLQAESLFGKI